MAEAHTDPESPSSVPLAVLATAAWHLRAEAHAAARVCERIATSGRDPDVRELARALQGVLFRIANLGVAARRPGEERPSRWRRVLLALFA